MEPVTMAKAINLSLRDALAGDEQVLVFGEDVGTLGGVFRITDGLQNRFGADRVFDTPLAESTIIGIAVGLALRGFRPVPEIQFDGFVYSAFDQIVSHVAKYRNRSGISMPITIRIPFGGHIGAVEHHSESPEAYFTHTAGLKVVAPATPGDAYGLLRSAIADPDPVIFFEPKARYYMKEEINPELEVPIGSARVAREGSGASVIAYGPTVSLALEAATAAEKENISLEVIDLRSLSPLDMPTILTSLQKTHRAVVVHEAPVFGGFGGENPGPISDHGLDLPGAPGDPAGGREAPHPPPRFEKPQPAALAR